MARKQAAKAKQRHPDRSAAPSRPIWTGSIDFGLVNIPVKLFSAEAPGSIDFDLLDKRDFSRVRYKRVSERTGREVPWEEIVKGYEYRKGEYVALGENDFLQANVEATQSIPITDFVDGQEISPIYFDKPYYLEPIKNGRRAYALLRDVLRRSGKVGIAKVVIRSRQHLAALIADGPVLVLNLLRFPHELRDRSGLDVPAETGGKAAGVSAQEIKMAEQLVRTMIRPWRPEQYHDEYQEDLHKLIEAKIASGEARAPATAPPSARPRAQGKVVDIMHLLKQSVEKASKAAPEPARRRKAG